MIQSVQKVMRMLEYMVQNGNLVRLQDLADSLEMKKSTAHHFLKTLESLGYIEQEALSTRYYLTNKIHELIPAELSTAALKVKFRPVLEEITKQLGETTYLTIQLGTYMRHELKAEPNRSVRISLEVGKEMEVINSALGNVFMAHSESLRRQLFQQLSLQRQAELAQQLEQVNLKGYALDYERLEKELNCVAVPVYENKKIVAAIGISGPSYRFDSTDMLNGVQLIQHFLRLVTANQSLK